jgi:hypothetical protein
MALVAAADHPNVKMMLDLYHAQIGEGNLIELVRAAMPPHPCPLIPGCCLTPESKEIHREENTLRHLAVAASSRSGLRRL